MSLYKDSTLAMIPTAYKDGKLYSVRPTDGSGDFTFSRGTTATRVASSGYIEKGRENLSLYSNTFSSWTAQSGGSVTSGQAGYDGTSDAWLLTSGAATYSRIERAISHTGLYTISVYAKAGTLGWLSFENSGITSDESYFDLTTGTLGSLGANVVTANIESIGSGWYRCSATLNGTSATQRIYPAVGDGDLNSAQGNIYIQDFQFEQGLVATDYIETGASTAQAGILEDMPRLDYSGGASCPSLLLEPSRTNYFPHSEYLASYAVNRGSITSNATTSPEGVVNASELVPTTDNGDHTLNALIDFGNVTNTFSIFAKNNGNDITITFAGSSTNWTGCIFDLTNGVAKTPQQRGSQSVCTATIEPYGDDWYKCSITATPYAGGNFYVFVSLVNDVDGSLNSSWGRQSFVGVPSETAYLYGGDLQRASYPTSYIPTYGSSVTRSADSCLATSVSDLIGQTEGTLFFECTNKALVNQARYFLLSDGGFNNRIDIYQFSEDNLGLYVATSGVAQVSVTNIALPSSGSFKFAVAYANNDYVWYLNGTQIGTDTSASVPTLTNALFALNAAGGTLGGSGNSPFKQAVLFPTRLTNTELAALTTL